jgi:hypothetical protein
MFGRERLKGHPCSSHLVPHFEECSPGVTMNPEFILWEHHGTFPIVVVTIVAGLTLP